MSCCEPAAPQVETFEEQVTRVTRSVLPEKSRVVRLCMESQVRDRVCTSIRECKRQCYRAAKFLKRSMRDVRAVQNLVPKAPTKKELAQRKADEEGLAACTGKSTNCGYELLVANAYAADATIRCLMQKARALSDCCVTLVLSVECVCGTYISGSLFF